MQGFGHFGGEGRQAKRTAEHFGGDADSACCGGDPRQQGNRAARCCTRVYRSAMRSPSRVTRPTQAHERQIQSPPPRAVAEWQATLYAAFGSREKTLHANPDRHAEVPARSFSLKSWKALWRVLPDDPR